MVFLKVSPMKGVVRIGRSNKLNSRYAGLFEILKWIRPLAYRLTLPLDIEKIHDVFHVSQLRKYILDLSHILSYLPLQIQKDLSYKKELVQILDHKVKQLRFEIDLQFSVLFFCIITVEI